MEVDIVSQLVPNVTTLIVQLCSTLVLFLLAKKVLWKSVTKFLDAREEKMQADLTESEAAKKDALAVREQALAELTEASAKSEEIVNAAVRQANDEKKAILEQAAKEASLEKQKAREQIETERREMQKSVQNEIIDVALAAAGRLVGAKNGQELDKQAVESFVKEVSGNDE